MFDSDKLNDEVREKLDSIISYWARRWEPFYSDEAEKNVSVFSKLKNNSEKKAVKRVLSGLRDIFLEYKSKLSDDVLQYDLKKQEVQTPSIIESPKEYMALKDEILMILKRVIVM